MSEMEKLADCPECKSGNTIMGQTFSSDGVRYMVCCGKCGANSGRYELKADAAAAWSQRPIFPLKALEAASKEIGHQVRVEIYALAEDTLETCHAKANDGGPDDHEHGFLRGRLSEAKSSSRALGNVITDDRIATIMSLHLGPDALRQHATALEIGRGEWQLIETAPEMKKILAGYFNELGKWRTVTACYYPAGTLDIYEDSFETEDGYAPAGWYEESETHENILQLHPEPTHWQPCPRQPSAIASLGVKNG